jgi:putative transposase
VDAATRASLAVLAKLFEWRGALMVVRSTTFIRWHRAGWSLFWRLWSRPGRPPIPMQLRILIRRMASENPLWGEERIANELLFKLGIRVSPRTVSKYLPKRPPGRPRGDQRWSTFLRNHATAILACDFFVAVTATFRVLYVFVVIEHGTRRLAHMNVTSHPSANWTLQQLREVIGDTDNHKYLIHDRDAIFAKHLDDSIRALGLEVLRTPDRNDTPGVPRLDDSDVRGASAVDPSRVGRSLQQWEPSQRIGSWGAGPSGEIRAGFAIRISPSIGGGCARARQSGAGRFAS